MFLFISSQYLALTLQLRLSLYTRASSSTPGEEQHECGTGCKQQSSDVR